MRGEISIEADYGPPRPDAVVGHFCQVDFTFIQIDSGRTVKQIFF